MGEKVVPLSTFKNEKPAGWKPVPGKQYYHSHVLIEVDQYTGESHTIESSFYKAYDNDWLMQRKVKASMVTHRKKKEVKELAKATESTVEEI